VDTVSGGDGNDQIYLSDDGSLDGGYARACGSQALADDVTNNAVGNAGADLIQGGTGADCIRGGDGNDALLGSGGPDDLRGNAGADFIAGQNGNDFVRDGFNSDQVSGGNGANDVWQRCLDGTPDDQDGTFETIQTDDSFC
jgi:Ca2+-binding RTX toxin-like protein